jgi:PKD repeat protein
MDWAYLIPSMAPLIVEYALPLLFPGKAFGITPEQIADILLPVPFSGADLWRFRDNDTKAWPVSLRGLGNKRNYGIRTMATSNGRLYLGTANAMNLHPEGGWEIYSLTDVNADFFADKPISNPGSEITFYPEIVGNEPDSLLWLIPGSDTPTSTEKNPVVTFSQPGYYDVTMIVFINGETFTVKKQIYIEVVPVDEGQCIDLYKGWMGVSTYMLPFEKSIEAIAAPLVSDPLMGELIILLSESGFYWPAYNINNLSDWKQDRGYKIKMTDDAYLCILGEPITNMELTLEDGVHLLPVITEEAVSAESVFGSCASLQYAFDYINDGIYWPEGNMMSLDTLYPGLAYLIRLSDECTFVFPESDAGRSLSKQFTKQTFVNPVPVWNDPVKTASAHIISVYPEALGQLGQGDIIGAFNAKGSCVGMVQISNVQQNLGLVIWADDETSSEVDGCVEGEIIEFRVFSEQKNTENRITPVFDEKFVFHNGKFANNGYSGIKEFEQTGAGMNTDLIPGLEIFPNPAKDRLNIFCPGIESGTIVSINNLKGQQMLTVKMEINQLILDISKFEKGFYFVKITNNSKVVVKQVVKY